ncbi:MAG TPA: phosphoribosylaminoimidazolesuccinocarboxamide synthase [Elusimicrobia bacterium]|nr:phosphoribosylaminoimidazolesuccinocarboxamide synthase [Elusimicrobiota bacterium]
MKNEIKLLHKGKVRDVYSVGEKYLLIVSSDRISAFDFILPTPVPGKGELLNRISLFWFERTKHIINNHIVASDIEAIKSQVSGHKEYKSQVTGHKSQAGGMGDKSQVTSHMSQAGGTGDKAQVTGHKTVELDWEYMKGRALLVRRTKRINFECVVRGYITGSGWKEYLKAGTVCGIKLPPGLKEAQKLPEPIFTPTTKADHGHDQNVTFEEMAADFGVKKTRVIKAKSLELYNFAAAYAEARGIILADTKFEFGELEGHPDSGGGIILIDEALTPDSSRFWDKAAYKIGSSPESFDKQFVRDWLEKESGWDKTPPPPELPAEVVAGTLEKYKEALNRLTGL